MGLYYPVVVKGIYFDSVRQAAKKLHICAKYIRRKCKIIENEDYYFTEYRIPDKKECCICHEVKLLSDFFNSKLTRDFKSTDCKICSVKASNKNRKDNFNRYKDNTLKRIFNITLEEYNTLFNNQNGCCAICGKHQSELKKSLCVDHDHITNKIRGLLCQTCNVAIGLLKDDVNILQMGVEYLKQYKNND